MNFTNQKVILLMKEYLEDDSKSSKKASVVLLKHLIETLQEYENQLKPIVEKRNLDLSIYRFMLEDNNEICPRDKNIIREFICSKFISE